MKVKEMLNSRWSNGVTTIKLKSHFVNCFMKKSQYSLNCVEGVRMIE